MPGTSPRYTPEFRAESVQPVYSSDKSIVQIAREFGTPGRTLPTSPTNIAAAVMKKSASNSIIV